MGYPVEMIGKDTKLYAIIGSSAIEHKLQDYFNHYFQEMDVDCKAMALNIREDDLGFFLNGLKDSKIKAVFFEQEYWKSVYTLLNPDDKACRFSTICDTIEIKNGTYNSSLIQGKALLELFCETEAITDKTFLIIGNTPSAKSFFLELIKSNPKKILFADDIIENMLEMIQTVPDTISHDIFRIKEQDLDIETDFSVNFTQTKYPIDSAVHIDFDKDFDKIINKIAQLKTKEWTENG